MAHYNWDHFIRTLAHTLLIYGPDDHHAQSHGHTGSDGSGTVAHSSLTGVSADQHHAGFIGLIVDGGSINPDGADRITIADGSGVNATGSTNTVTLALAALTATWAQTGLFNIQHSGRLDLFSDAGQTTQTMSLNNSTGHIGLPSTSSSAVINIAKTTSSSGFRIIQGTLTLDTGGVGTATAFNFNPTYTGSGGLTGLGAIDMVPTHGGTGAIEDLFGYRAKWRSDAAGTTTRWQGFWAASPDGTTTPPTTTHVLRGDDQGAAGVTTAYGLKIAAQTGTAARSYVADPLVLGATDAQPASGELLSVYGHVAVRPVAAAAQTLRLYDNDASNFIAFRANPTRTTDIVYVWPATDPTAGQILSASAPSAGVVTLSWVADATGAGAVATDVIWDAKGDLAVGTGSNTAVRLPVGADDTILMARASEATGLIWIGRSTTTEIADVGNSESAGTDDTVPRGDHVHAHGSRTNSNAHRDEDIDCTSMKQTVLLTAGGGKGTTTSPAAGPTQVEAGTNDVDYWVLDFDATTQEFAFWGPIVMPDNWDASTLTAKVIWTSAGGAAGGTVVWGIQMACRGDDDAIDQAWGTAVEVSDDWIANGDVHISAESAAITPAGTLGAGKLMFIRVYRDPADASDDLTGDARLLGVRIEYGVNTLSA